MWIHRLPGRVRARVPGMRHHPTLAAHLEHRLAGCPGVLSATASALTGTLLIRFNPEILNLDVLTGFITSPAATEVAATAMLEPAGDPPTAQASMGGLTATEAAARRSQVGSNLLEDPPRQPFLLRLLAQYKGVMQLTLIAGAGLSYLSGHRRDALTIGAVLLFNGFIGATQGSGAVRSVAALRQMTDQIVKVVRDDLEQLIPATDLVPGDLLLLEEGDRIPADAEVIASAGLAIDESLLTGECAAVEKSVGMPRLSAGTCVVRGRGYAVVTATGMSSTLGRIASLMERDHRPAPAQKQLDGLARTMAKGGFCVAAGVTAIGLLRGMNPLTALMAGTSLLISAIPEGLPALITLALAAGARRMSQRHATFQNLAAVEMMGTVSALCCDKTGTLTQGEMAVTELSLPDGVWQVTGGGYAPDGEFHRVGRRIDPLQEAGLRRLLQVGALCNNARLSLDAQGALVTRGDPTELALLVAALKAGIRTCGADGDRVLELPFDADRRLMSVVCRDATDRAVACVKGAPEVVLSRCTAAFAKGTVGRFDSRNRRRVAREAAAMAGRGLRVLAVAYRPVSLAATAEEVERDLVFLGLVGIVDPPRPEAADMVARCHRAGVRVVMITGDHPATAAHVASRVGIPAQGSALLTGDQIAAMSDAALAAAARELAVVARAVPEQKLRLVRALRQAGHVVAMTGDGVNDAPAMREADVGIAMGDGGTEVARTAAGLILQNDDLRTIVDAIEEGRGTRRNIQHTARYLLGSNAAEVCLMAGALLLGLPLPLLPVQLLWMNLVGDGLPASALGSQPPEPGLMHRPPDRPDQMIGHGFTRKVLGHGLRTGLIATGIYAWAFATGRPVGQARTMAMAALATAQVRHLWGAGAVTPQVRQAGALTVALALGAIYFPPLRRTLQFEALGLGQLALASGLAMTVK